MLKANRPSLKRGRKSTRQSTASVLTEMATPSDITTMDSMSTPIDTFPEPKEGILFGVETGLQVLQILGATKSFKNELYFLVHYANDSTELVPNQKCIDHCSHQLIEFYEKNIVFQPIPCLNDVDSVSISNGSLKGHDEDKNTNDKIPSSRIMKKASKKQRSTAM